jgi:hypothetical protein
MGIIQNDSLTLENGIEISNTYASFATNSIQIISSANNVVSVNGTLTTWANQAARIDNKVSIKNESFYFSIEKSSLTDDLFKLMYEKYKTHTDGTYQDVLIDPTT